MSSQLSPDQLAQLVPLLGRLARLLARDPDLTDKQLELLVEASDLRDNPATLTEPKRWASLLQSIATSPGDKVRHAVMEGLLLRGLPEAAVLLVVVA